MLGIFKKKARKAVVEVKKMENRDAVEATVWGAYSIAYADGTCDAKEIATLEKTISALPSEVYRSQVLIQRKLQSLSNFLQLFLFFFADTVIVSNIEAKTKNINSII